MRCTLHIIKTGASHRASPQKAGESHIGRNPPKPKDSPKRISSLLRDANRYLSRAAIVGGALTRQPQGTMAR